MPTPHEHHVRRSPRALVQMASGPRSLTTSVAPGPRRSAMRPGWRPSRIMRPAPRRFAAITPQRPTAPSPTTATILPGPTRATTAAWWPVPMTSASRGGSCRSASAFCRSPGNTALGFCCSVLSASAPTATGSFRPMEARRTRTLVRRIWPRPVRRRGARLRVGGKCRCPRREPWHGSDAAAPHPVHRGGQRGARASRACRPCLPSSRSAPAQARGCRSSGRR